MRLLLPSLLAAAILVLPTLAQADEDPLPELLEDLEPAPAAVPTTHNCLDAPRTRLFTSQVLGIKYGPWGLEHQLRLGVCTPLSRKPGVLTDLSSLKAGLVMHTSPIYVMPGAFLKLTPVSFLVLHFDIAPVFYWPIGLEGAGYYPLAGYDSPYDRPDLPADEGQTALGWYFRTGVTVQAAFSLGPVRMIIKDDLYVERWKIGTAEHYFHNRNDLPAANPEWFIDNSALVMVEIPVHPNAVFRVGVNDQLVMNLGAEQKSNVLAGVAMVSLKKLGRRVRDFSPILRIGGRTHHPERQGDFTFIVALAFDADLSARTAALQP